MKAVVKTDLGPGVQILDRPVPEIGPEDVLLRVEAACICGSDLGFYAGGAELEGVLCPPVILGHEFAGVVERVGAAVTDWKPGDRAVSENTGHVCGKCPSCERGDYLLCPERKGIGYGMDGGFADYVRIPGDILKKYPNCLLPIPEGLSFEEAAMLDPASNAYRAVVEDARLLPGETVAVLGAGALGLFAVQMGRIAGAANVICISGARDEHTRLPLAKRLGATHTLVTTDPELERKVAEIAGADGVALAVECAGPAQAVRQALRLVRNGGTVVKVGMNSGVYGDSLDILSQRGITLKGHMGYDAAANRNVLNLMRQGALQTKPLITHRLPVTEFETGIELLRQRNAIKVILYPER